MIGSYFEFFAGRSHEGGFLWGQRMWRDFVQAGQIYSRAIPTVPAQVERPPAVTPRSQLRRQVVDSAATRPARTANELDALRRICVVVGDAPISGEGRRNLLAVFTPPLQQGRGGGE
jgi:hypothetical protein